MKKSMNEILASREEILMKHIDLDRRSVSDQFLCHFMMGRVEMEESWLDETRRFLNTSLEPKAIMEILLNRRAILKSWISDAKSQYEDIDGQKMRGKVAIITHWLEETEKLISSLDKEQL